MMCLGWIGTPLLASAVAVSAPQEAICLGSRLELFVDDYLLDALHGEAHFVLHKPEPEEVVLITDKPWEGNTCAYYTIFQDGDVYRLYYRGSHFDTEKKKFAHPEVVCYAESRDGIHWVRPELGLFEFAGSKTNNIVWSGNFTHNFTPFKDGNPACKPTAQYKALASGNGAGGFGLRAFQSPDGIHWSLMREEPVITNGAFDSQNLAFWDPVRGEYRAYWRIFKEGVRDIRTATSKDFLNWSECTDLDYGDAPKEHLYTNAILPYPRAPHLFIGFPTRFLPQTEQVEPELMTSRDGCHFHRWTDPVIPMTAPADRDGNRSNYLAWGMVQLPGDDRHYSLYATEAYYTGPASRLRRFTYRVDGFVSLSAGNGGGEVITRPLTFAGAKLILNFTTQERGELRVEIQDASGAALRGYTLNDCFKMRGDEIADAVRWRRGTDVSSLAGRSVRLRFVMRNADLYSFQFR